MILGLAVGLNIGLFVGACLSQYTPAPALTVWITGIASAVGVVVCLNL